MATFYLRSLNGLWTNGGCSLNKKEGASSVTQKRLQEPLGLPFSGLSTQISQGPTVGHLTLTRTPDKAVYLVAFFAALLYNKIFGLIYSTFCHVAT